MSGSYLEGAEYTEEINYCSIGDSDQSWRGLVLPSAADYEHPHAYLTEIDASPQELRGYLFLWDRLVYPTEFKGRPKHPYINDDLEILRHQTYHTGRASKIIEFVDDIRPQGEHERLARRRQCQLFEVMEKKNSGRWAIAESSRLPLEIPGFGRSLLVRLWGAIPIPQADVRFDDIAGFRERRRSELLECRYHIEQLFAAIQSSPDPDASFVSEFENLSRSVGGLVATLEQRRLNFRMVGLQVRLKWECDLGAVRFDPSLIASSAVVGDLLGGLKGALTAGVIAAAAHNLFPKIEVELAKAAVTAANYGPLHYTLLINDEFKDWTGRSKRRRAS